MPTLTEVQKLTRREKTVRVDPILESLVPRFLENRSRDITALLGALDDQDFDTVQSIGHALKGTGSAYGFDVVSILGAEIEDSGKREDAVEATRWIELLRKYLQGVNVLYEPKETP